MRKLYQYTKIVSCK